MTTFEKELDLKRRAKEGTDVRRFSAAFSIGSEGAALSHVVPDWPMAIALSFTGRPLSPDNYVLAHVIAEMEHDHTQESTRRLFDALLEYGVDCRDVSCDDVACEVMGTDLFHELKSGLLRAPDMRIGIYGLKGIRP